MVEKETIARYETGYIKLMKMSKGYNWEIKYFEDMNMPTFQVIMKNLEEIDSKMQEKWGDIIV